MSDAHAETRALITGGTQGLGLAIAAQLRAEGCTQMVLAGRDREKGEKAAAEHAVRFIGVDMADVGSVRNMVDLAAEQMGGITALVNAAADTGRGSILDTVPEDWDRIMNVNARGPFFATQRVAQLAVKSGHAASIVNILSMAIHCGQGFLAPYSASKAALANVTRNAAQALRYHRIRVNGIACGWMNTPGEDATQRRFHGAGDDWLARAEAAQPFAQLVEPRQVAVLAAYMAGPLSGVMTGAVVDFDQNVAGAYPE